MVVDLLLSMLSSPGDLGFEALETAVEVGELESKVLAKRINPLTHYGALLLAR
jgi:hypothetical protein